MMLMPLLLLLLPAQAEDDCSAQSPDEDDPQALILRWAMGMDENQPPELEIYAPAGGDLTVEVEYRLGLDGATITWSSGPWTPEALDVIADPVLVPADAFWDPEQAARLSSMTVEVSAWSGGTLLYVASIAPLRVAFPYGADDPVFLDADLVADLAPGGVLLDSPAAAVIGDWEVTETREPVAVDADREIVRIDEKEEN